MSLPSDHQPQPATVFGASRYEHRWTRRIHGLCRAPHLRHCFTGRVATIPEPGINVMFECPDRPSLHVKLSTDGQTLTFLPALDRAHFPVQINRNLLPRVEAVPR